MVQRAARSRLAAIVACTALLALASVAPAWGALTCDSGTLDTTCVVSTAQVVDEPVVGVSLSVTSSGSLNCDNSAGECATTIRMSGAVTLDGTIQGGNVSVSGASLTMAASGRLHANYRGFDGGKGPGVAGNATVKSCDASFSGGGGGHGGDGAASTYKSASSACDITPSTPAPGGPGGYGSITQPSTAGSGGGHAYFFGGDGVDERRGLGGRGGGVVRVDLQGLLTMTSGAIISANGEAGTTVSSITGGGGAGGSVWITAAQVLGTGLVSADGGARVSGAWSGGGGGGRVAIHSTTTIADTISARALGGYGSAVRVGAAGTVFLSTADGDRTEVVVFNTASGSTASTPLTAALVPAKLTKLFVKSYGVVRVDDAQHVRAAEVELESQSRLVGDVVNIDVARLEVMGVVEVDTRVRFSDAGYTAADGAPTCASAVDQDLSYTLSLETKDDKYDNTVAALTDGDWTTGAKTNAWIQASFKAPVAVNAIRVAAHNVTKSSYINSQIIEYTNDPEGTWVRAKRHGSSASVTNVDNTGVVVTQHLDVAKAQYWRLRESPRDIALSEFSFACEASYHHVHGTVRCTSPMCGVEFVSDRVLPTWVRVYGTVHGGDVVVNATNSMVKGVVRADYLGYPTDQGPGAGPMPTRSFSSCAGKAESISGVGGTHGGIGGRSCISNQACSVKPESNHEVYGSVTRPRTFGSGGSSGVAFPATGEPTRRDGGAGGGRVMMLATQHVNVLGSVTALGQNYQSASYYSGGAGAGGSILLEAAVVGGQGTVSAHGGEATTSTGSSGGGGGGRIALLAASRLSKVLVVTAAGSKSGSCDGGAGPVYRRDGAFTSLHYHNDGSSTHTATPLPAVLPLGLDELLTERSANVSARTGTTVEASSVFIHTASYLVGDDFTVASDNVTVVGAVIAGDRVEFRQLPDATASTRAKAGCPLTRDPALDAYTVKYGQGLTLNDGDDRLLDNHVGTYYRTPSGVGAHFTFTFPKPVTASRALIWARGGGSPVTYSYNNHAHWEYSLDGGVTWQFLRRIANSADGFTHMDPYFRPYDFDEVVTAAHWRLHHATRATVLDVSEVRFECDRAALHVTDGYVKCEHDDCAVRVDMPQGRVTVDSYITGSTVDINAKAVTAYGRIHADHRGHRSDAGPAPGTRTSRDVLALTSHVNGAGGGHGGQGGMNKCTGTLTHVLRGGDAYGSAVNPTQYGSGGSWAYCYSCFDHRGGYGGAGGGFVRLVASDSVAVLNSLSVSAMGQNGRNWNGMGGAGAGGSIQVRAARVVGRGTVQADGASTSTSGGNGAGGRIAVYAASVEDTIVWQAEGGRSTGCIAAAGTVFTNITGFTQLRMWQYTAPAAGVFTPYPHASLPEHLDRVEVSEDVRLWLEDGATLRTKRLFTHSTSKLFGPNVRVDVRWLDVQGDVESEDSMTFTDESFRGVPVGYTCPTQAALDDWNLLVSKQDNAYMPVQKLLVDDDPMTSVRTGSETAAYVELEFMDPILATGLMVSGHPAGGYLGSTLLMLSSWLRVGLGWVLGWLRLA